MLCAVYCWVDDAVFLDDEEKRDEYVLNDTGKIYTGNYKQVSMFVPRVCESARIVMFYLLAYRVRFF